MPASTRNKKTGQRKIQQIKRPLALPQAAQVKGGNAQRGQVRQQTCRTATICTCGAQKQEAYPIFFALQQHGLLVIRGSKGAAREIVEDGVDGFAVDPDDIFLFADRLNLRWGGRSRQRRWARPAAGKSR
jgi:hypothetical protein